MARSALRRPQTARGGSERGGGTINRPPGRREKKDLPEVKRKVEAEDSDDAGVLFHCST